MSNKTRMQHLAGSTIVLKFGGNAMVDESLLEAFAKDIALLQTCGIRPIVVHGGGPQISKHLGKLGLASTFIDGARVTSKEVLEAVRMTLVGNVGRTIVGYLAKQNVAAVGISGEDGQLVETKQVNKDLGYVGQIQAVNPALLFTLVGQGYVPVLAPIGLDNTGQACNHNADVFAAAIAVAVNAVKTIFLTDVAGLLRDATDATSRIPALSSNELAFIMDGDDSISAGMMPKLEACQKVVAGGSQAYIVDGRIAHSVRLLLDGADMGTTIAANVEVL